MEITGDTYTRIWGQLDGKQQSKATTAKGKNIGKANETTPEQQAIIEAEAVWTKKQKANYSTSQEAPVTIDLPMKVSVFQKHLKKIDFENETVYISPKLDGVNCEYRIDESGSLSLLSRGGEKYPIPMHQVDHIEHVMAFLGTSRLNGEMYIHGQYLQDITAAVKKPNELTKDLEFHIFDLPEFTNDYNDRCRLLATIPAEYSHVKVVAIDVATSLHDISLAFDEAIGAGYEGLMVRLGSNTYKYNTRSLSVFKYKKALDAEFKITGYSIDKNGHAVFEAITPEEGTFKVKLKGTSEERLAMAEVATTYIGKWLKVEYETLSKDSIPLKPVGLMFRSCTTEGEPTE
jgi:DNA ligase-1